MRFNREFEVTKTDSGIRSNMVWGDYSVGWGSYKLSLCINRMIATIIVLHCHAPSGFIFPLFDSAIRVSISFSAFQRGVSLPLVGREPFFQVNDFPVPEPNHNNDQKYDCCESEHRWHQSDQQCWRCHAIGLHIAEFVSEECAATSKSAEVLVRTTTLSH